MAGTVLYVVDMQYGFPASEKIIDETIREIRLARRRKDHIVFVELAPLSNGITHGQLLETAGVKRTSRIKKRGADGSEEFIAEIKKIGLKHKRVRVCGVNRDACVMNTVSGLMNRLPENIGIELACAATADYAHTKWNPTGYTEMVFARSAKEGRIKLK